MAELLNVDVALAQILREISPLAGEHVPISAAQGRILAEDIRSAIDLPPFANSSMDGFAVVAADTTPAAPETPVHLPVVMDIPAGSAPDTAIRPGQAARIMTGAPMPPGADAVVPVEDTDQQFNINSDLPAEIQVYTAVKPGSSVRPIGEDIAANQRVLQAGNVLRPQDIGVLAALGYAQIPVIRQPRVALLSSGDELVEIDQPLTPGKIRDVNGYTLAGLVTEYGGIPLRLPIARDTLADVRQRFQAALDSRPDLILSSAGVSVGTFDLVRSVLAELGEVNFWRVNLRPGKPLAFGHVGGVPFFGLPGNPVSAMVTFDVFVRPVLLALTGRPNTWPIIEAAVGEALTSDGRRSYLRVQIQRQNGQVIASTTGTQSSGALTSMVRADGLLIIPEGVRQVAAGTMLQVRLFNPEAFFSAG